MLSKIEKQLLGLLCLCLFLIPFSLAGCGTPIAAQQGGGLLSPTPAQIASNKTAIVPSAPALAIQITNFCNAQAAVDYSYAAQYCGGTLMTNALPIELTSTMANQAKAAWCLANQWTSASGQLAINKDSSGNFIVPTLGNCPSGATPAPVTAPSGAAAAKS